MATAPLSESHDDALVLELRGAVAEAAAVPASFAAAARGSLTWRTIDADLESASLCFDSALDGQALVRGPAAAVTRSLVFIGTADITLEVDVHAHELVGRIAAAGPHAVRLRGADGSLRTATSDEDGWFRIAPVPHGPQRFECETDAGSFVTAWTVL